MAESKGKPESQGGSHEQYDSFIPTPEPEPPAPPPPAPPEPRPKYLIASLGAAPEKKNPLPTAGEVSHQEPQCRECGKVVGPVRRLASNFCSRRCASKFEKESKRLETQVAQLVAVLVKPTPPPYGDRCANWVWHRAHLVREREETKKALRGRKE